MQSSGVTSLCGPEPFISACTRQLSPFPPSLPFFPFLLCITSAATHSSILQGSCMTHHKQTAPAPTSCSIPAQRAWDLLAWLLCGLKPAWERLRLQARLALMLLSCSCPSPPPSPEAATGLKWHKQLDVCSHVSIPDTSKSRLAIKKKTTFTSWLALSPNLAGGHSPSLLKVFSSSE